ncbi:poly-beta-hydroxybutyrate polymerase N-terminal domain-containing protein [Paraburkholderia sp. GAS41]|uniref:poly-beta-hydroxybutyrate polymerase N-terminal domain-containing protein n=1 Tax=Paraburkholderia sp. GAS41 TaxID=3035134 RepID=UPI003D1D39DD
MDRTAVSAATESFRARDHAKEAMIARMAGGLSPASLRAALADWLIHLAAAPGKQLELASLCAQNAQRITECMVHSSYCNQMTSSGRASSTSICWASAHR